MVQIFILPLTYSFIILLIAENNKHTNVQIIVINNN